MARMDRRGNAPSTGGIHELRTRQHPWAALEAFAGRHHSACRGPEADREGPWVPQRLRGEWVPPQRLEKAAAEHAALRKSVPSTPEWDVGVYMRTHRPTVPHKPYATLSSAEEMRDYLARMGWLNCAVRELKREAQE